MAAIFFASADSDPPTPANVSDKSLHLLAYAGLAVLVFRALSGGMPARARRRTVIATLLITIGYGLSDELHQMYVPGRSPELADVYADAAGAGVALIACWAWGIIARPRFQVPNPDSQSRS